MVADLPAEGASLLASLVWEGGYPPEPVATRSLLYLLNLRGGTRAALQRWCGQLCPDLPTDLRWSGEVRVATDAARPDLVGEDDLGARVVLEAKFDAHLTQAQVDETYLSRLLPGRPGLLVFLAPVDRLDKLRRELRGILDAAEVVAGSSHRFDLRDGRHVALVSWSELLDRAGAEDASAAEGADLRQLRGLVAQQVGHGWVPRGVRDLDQRTGRQLAGLLGVAVDVLTNLSGDKTTQFRGSQGNADRSNGRWITGPDGLTVWLGMWPGQWARVGLSPMWVSADVQPRLTPDRLAAAFDDFRDVPGVWPSTKGLSVPLLIEVGAELPDVVASAEALVRRMMRSLAAAAAPVA
jgi:hypothetical protein